MNMNIKNQITMRRYTYTLIIITFLILSTSIISNASGYSIDNNNRSVWVTGDYGKLEATPHTITQSGWVYFNITPYKDIGNIDMVWGFNTSEVKPRKAEFYKPHIKTWKTYHKKLFKNVSYIESTLDKCDYGNEYNKYKRKITYSFNNTTITKVVCFDFYDVHGKDYTIYWHTTHSKYEKWYDVSNKFSSINYKYDNKTKWWYVTNFVVEPYKTYTFKIWVNVPVTFGKISGKYDFAVKRSSDSLYDAILYHRFYLLDPWFNSSYDERMNVSINCTEPINYYQMNFNLSHSDIPEAQQDFDDVRFINVSDNTELPYWIEKKVDDDWCSFWVNVTSLNAGWNNDTVAIYYGNSEVSNNSNYDATFTKTYNKSGMVLELHMDEGSGYSQTNDTSGCGNDGTLNNMNLTGNDTSGWVGYDGGQWDNRSDVNFSTGDSLRFDGNDDYVDCGNDSSLNITDAITIEVWAKSSFSAPKGTFVSKSNERHDYLFYFTSAGNLRLTIGNGTAYQTLQKIISITPNVFYHYAATFNGNIWKLYLNGEKIASNSLVWTIGNNNDNVYIGTYQPSNMPFNGTIDEVRIYNRSLSADEIYRHYIYSKYTLNPPTYTLSDTEHYPYPPATPINLTADTSSRSGHVIWSWSAGTGNVTDSYNVSVDSIWYNDTTSTSYDDNVYSSTSSIIVYAFNNSGYLSAGNVSGSQRGKVSYSSIIDVIDAVIPLFDSILDLIIAIVPFTIVMIVIGGLIILVNRTLSKVYK